VSSLRKNRLAASVFRRDCTKAFSTLPCWSLTPPSTQIAHIHQRDSAAAVAVFLMTADLGAMVCSLVVGQLAEHLTFGWSFTIGGIVLHVAAAGWVRLKLGW
jgi:hypothetical protein